MNQQKPLRNVIDKQNKPIRKHAISRTSPAYRVYTYNLTSLNFGWERDVLTTKLPLPNQTSQNQVFELCKLQITTSPNLTRAIDQAGYIALIVGLSPYTSDANENDYNCDYVLGSVQINGANMDASYYLPTSTFDLTDGRGNGIYITKPNLYVTQVVYYAGNEHAKYYINIFGRTREVSVAEMATLST